MVVSDEWRVWRKRKRNRNDAPSRPDRDRRRTPRPGRGGYRALMRGDQKAKKDTPHPPVFVYVGETKDLADEEAKKRQKTGMSDSPKWHNSRVHVVCVPDDVAGPSA